MKRARLGSETVHGLLDPGDSLADLVLGCGIRHPEEALSSGSETLLKEGHVAVTPGTAFGPGGEGFFRVSYAASEDQIREGIARIKKTMNSL